MSKPCRRAGALLDRPACERLHAALAVWHVAYAWVSRGRRAVHRGTVPDVACNHCPASCRSTTSAGKAAVVAPSSTGAWRRTMSPSAGLRYQRLQQDNTHRPRQAGTAPTSLFVRELGIHFGKGGKFINHHLQMGCPLRNTTCALDRPSCCNDQAFVAQRN